MHFIAIMDLQIGLVYFLPTKASKPPEVKTSSGFDAGTRTKTPPPDPDGKFYDFGNRLLKKISSLKSNSDLLYSNISFDAMSLSSYIEAKRLKDTTPVPFDRWAGFVNRQAAWRSVYQTLCNGKCSMLTFRVTVTTAYRYYMTIRY